MEWLRRRKAKKNFKKLKEAYDLGYRHARENMQVELDNLQKQIFEASKREKQLMREVDLLSKQLAVERREHCNAFVTVAKQFTKAYYKLKVKNDQPQPGNSPSSPPPPTAHKLPEPTGGMAVEETDTTVSPGQHVWLQKERVPPPPGFETVVPNTSPAEPEADGVELQGSQSLPEEETSVPASCQPLKAE